MPRKSSRSRQEPVTEPVTEAVTEPVTEPVTEAVPMDVEKVKRAPNSWARAVKQWNQDTKTERYKIPRKGTEEYAEVRALMAKQSNSSTV